MKVMRVYPLEIVPRVQPSETLRCVHFHQDSRLVFVSVLTLDMELNFVSDSKPSQLAKNIIFERF